LYLEGGLKAKNRKKVEKQLIIPMDIPKKKKKCNKYTYIYKDKSLSILPNLHSPDGNGNPWKRKGTFLLTNKNDKRMLLGRQRKKLLLAKIGVGSRIKLLLTGYNI
jgi:hypothetical protein